VVGESSSRLGVDVQYLETTKNVTNKQNSFSSVAVQLRAHIFSLGRFYSSFFIKVLLLSASLLDLFSLLVSVFTHT